MSLQLVMFAPLIAFAKNDDIEISFAPSDGQNILFEGFSPTVRSSHAQEADLDEIIGTMLGGGSRPMPLVGQVRGGGFLDLPPISISQGPFVGSAGPSGLPAGLLRDLFPGPLSFGEKFIDHPQPFDRPDPLVQNLLSDVDTMFASAILPIAHKLASIDRAPNACQSDLKAHCADLGVKSQLHCLGEHQTDISAACHKEVGRSVPFRCGRYVDKFCDVLEDGLLPCLQRHLQELDDRCRDTVMATQNVIVKSKTATASVVDPATGVPKVSVPIGATGGAAARPSVAAMLNLANAGYDVNKDVEISYLFWTFLAALALAGIVLSAYALTFTPYCPRQLQSLLAGNRVEKHALLKTVDMPRMTDETFAA